MWECDAVQYNILLMQHSNTHVQPEAQAAPNALLHCTWLACCVPAAELTGVDAAAGLLGVLAASRLRWLWLLPTCFWDTWTLLYLNQQMRIAMQSSPLSTCVTLSVNPKITQHQFQNGCQVDTSARFVPRTSKDVSTRIWAVHISLDEAVTLWMEHSHQSWGASWGISASELHLQQPFAAWD
jgi:hypothetical protein